MLPHLFLKCKLCMSKIVKQVIYGRKILKRILQEKLQTGFIWLGIETSGGLW
jgi:hypothetical protein